MAALLLVAHGSRRAASNNEVRHLTDKLREVASDRFEQIECAFLELAEPLIPDGITCCINQGADEVVVLPYFLSAGRHVSEDIPGIVAETQARYPNIPIRIAPYLGESSDIVHTLLELAIK